MNPAPFVAIALVSTFGLCISAQNHFRPEPQGEARNESAKPTIMQVWNLEDVIAKHRASKKSYTRFFRVPSTNCGIYTLPKGGKDGQSPHTEDELYYVVKGRAKMHSDGKKVAVQPGSLIFVAAAAEHRFVEIEEDLELLVVFSSGNTQKAAAEKTKNQK